MTLIAALASSSSFAINDGVSSRPEERYYLVGTITEKVTPHITRTIAIIKDRKDLRKSTSVSPGDSLPGNPAIKIKSIGRNEVIAISGARSFSILHPGKEAAETSESEEQALVVQNPSSASPEEAKTTERSTELRYKMKDGLYSLVKDSDLGLQEAAASSFEAHSEPLKMEEISAVTSPHSSPSHLASDGGGDAEEGNAETAASDTECADDDQTGCSAAQPHEQEN
jgi:hypothetical protein